METLLSLLVLIFLLLIFLQVAGLMTGLSGTSVTAVLFQDNHCG